MSFQNLYNRSWSVFFLFLPITQASPTLLWHLIRLENHKVLLRSKKYWIQTFAALTSWGKTGCKYVSCSIIWTKKSDINKSKISKFTPNWKVFFEETQWTHQFPLFVLWRPVEILQHLEESNHHLCMSSSHLSQLPAASWWKVPGLEDHSIQVLFPQVLKY